MEGVWLYWKAGKILHGETVLVEGDSWGQAFRFIACSYFLFVLGLLTAEEM